MGNSINLSKINWSEISSLRDVNIKDPMQITQDLAKRMIEYTDSVFLEYLEEKGMTLEDAKRECEVRQYPQKTELWHHGELIFTTFISYPKLNLDNPSYCINYTFRIIKHWKGETLDDSNSM